MANESTNTSLNDLLSPIVAEALFVASEKSIMRGLVRNYTMASNTGKTVQVPIYPNISAAAVSEATDLDNTEVAASVANLTVSEVGVMTTLTDLAMKTSESDVVSDIGRLFGEAIARKIDVDLVGQFGNFTNTIIGTFVDGNPLAVNDLFNAARVLRGLGIDASQCAAVFHPDVAYDLKSGLTNTFANPAGQVGNEALRSGFIGTIAGINCYESGNISYTDNAGDYRGAVFHPDGMGLAMLQDLKIETQRDASMRGTEIVATAVYGTGILHGTYGVEVRADASLV